MTKEEIRATYNPESKWFGRSLDNYKIMQAKVAASKGLTKELQACRTLTQAKKLLFGLKSGNLK